METQFEYMLETAREWANRSKKGYLPRHLTWKAWMSTISKTLEFPLPVTTLTSGESASTSNTSLELSLSTCRRKNVPLGIFVGQ
jgi:hypothetical protein